MLTLNNQEIAFVIKRAEKLGVLYGPVKEEFVDHLCCEIEGEIEQGMRFADALEKVLQRYPNERVKKIQWNTYLEVNSKTKIMLKNYLKIAWRNLMKHKFYAGINVFGLAMGLTCCLLIILFVKDELSYDKYNKKSEQIFRLTGDIIFGGNEFKMTQTSEPMGRTLVEDYEFIESQVRFRNRGAFIVKHKENVFREEQNRITFTDSTFFDIFSVEVIKGNPSKALAGPNLAAISASTAKKYFGDEDPIGKQLKLDASEEVEVTAVYQDIPKNSHFHYNVLVSMQTIDDIQEGVWLSNNFVTYVLAKKGTTEEDIDRVIPGMLQRYAGPQIEKVLNKTLDEFQSAGNKLSYHPQPLADIHLYSQLDHEIEANGDIKYVYIFSAIALFILGIACINFMNLATARSANRAKEVGVRKVLGSYRSHLIRQFLTESVLMTIMASVLALVMAYLLLPFYNQLSGKELIIPFDSVLFYLVFVALALVVGLLSGFYPAFFLSGFKPIAVLKGKLNLGAKSGWVRSALVVFQFAISIFLIIGTLIIYNQMNFITNKKLGFSKDRVLVLNDVYMFEDQLSSFKNQITALSSVEQATVSGYLPVDNSNRSDTGFWLEGKEVSQDNIVSMQIWTVDHDYIKTLGMEVLKGRDFDQKMASDSTYLIINQEAARLFGIKDIYKNRIQTWKNIPEGSEEDSYETYGVLAIVEDFHFESMKKGISPVAFVLGESSSKMLVKINGNNVSTTINEIQAAWNKIIPDVPMVTSFLDVEFDAMYQSEKQMMRVFTIFSGLCIFIACLGLFALASFTAEQRTKEIGVRKVLGASVGNIVFLLTKEFGKLILIAFVLAVPLSWYIMNNWLTGFEYKIQPGIGLFLFAGIVSFTVAWLTMSFQTIRAALGNPVKSLKEN